MEERSEGKERYVLKNPIAIGGGRGGEEEGNTEVSSPQSGRIGNTMEKIGKIIN